MKKIYTLGLLTLTFLGAQAQTNLLLNGSFEGPLDAENLPENWTSSDTLQTSLSISLITDPSLVFNGAQSLNLSTDEINGGKIGDVFQIANGIEAGEVYTISFFYRYRQPETTDNSIGYAVLQWFDDADGDVPPLPEDAEFFGFIPATYLAQDVWLPATIDATAPATATKFFINISCGGVDDFAIDKVEIIKKEPLGLDQVSTNRINMYAQGNSLFVATQGGEQVSVYNLLGQKLAATIGTDTVTVLPNLQLNQMLVVKVDNKTAKVILR